VATLIVSYFEAVFSGPRPSVSAIGIGSLAGAALLMVLSWWADSQRALA